MPLDGLPDLVWMMDHMEHDCKRCRRVVKGNLQELWDDMNEALIAERCSGFEPEGTREFQFSEDDWNG